ncbi:Ada metal-binding domain-containing protein [Cellulomonas cellasea]|uniref:DNA-3-methyladenine glycosylase II n=1 Tax=Cellulomonas cellasea TaxID=43670 RepID=A0A7W4YDQ9_9CELL|nr:Ada metal-binding domain-containing protein [Cellulomonas cellasea]MBB2925419.1 AraC family transcriptional regulator of adaptative response / DNA-3-methyladenine glycosylase II [Cellulomonas cellasea]
MTLTATGATGPHGDDALEAPGAPWLDPAAAYRAISGRDPRFDGRLYVGVVSTGVYCRPSCPARTPRPENCRFYPAAAAAVAAGFRACRRCRPDALPGSRDWDVRGDLAARAVRAIADGAVDDVGVDGLAARLHVSVRHLHRVLVAEVGASPLQLARTRRAQLARMLLDQTDLSMADVAFGAGFASVRQFNDVVREHFGAPPSELRRVRRRGSVAPVAAGASDRLPVSGARLSLRLRFTPPFDAGSWFRHVAARAVPGLERATSGAGAAVGMAAAPAPGPDTVGLGVEALGAAEPGTGSRGADDTGAGSRRAADTGSGSRRAGDDAGTGRPEVSVTRLLRGGEGPVHVTVVLAADGSAVHAHLELMSLADLAPTVTRLRRWLDLDADPGLVAGALGGDPLLAPLLAARPGLRVPGTTDPFELAVRAVLGQQVSTAAARTIAGRLVAEHGEPGADGLSFFPSAATLAQVGTPALRALGLNEGRASTIGVVARAVADGLRLDPGADRERVRADLLALPGVGPWTADYVALRALGDPDVFPAGDLILRRALAELPGGAGEPVDVRAATARAAAWSPWRGYAAQHLWSAWSHRVELAAAEPRRPKTARRVRRVAR